MNKKLFISLTSALIFGTVFAASFGVGFAMQTKNADNTSFTIGAARQETKTKVYYQSSFFYGGEGTVYAYAWDSKNDSSINAAWPGEAMTVENYKHGLYSYEVSEKYDSIIFHANGGQDDPTKTVDLTIDRTNVYYCQHENEWNATLNDCSFSYYFVGNFNGTDKWNNRDYENGLLKNYAGNNLNEYLKADYTFKKDDEFQIVSQDNSSWYGVNGTKGNNTNYKVIMNNSSSKTAFVYFTPNSNLYSGVDYFYKRVSAGEGNKFWCHNWSDGGSGTSWPGNEMTRVNDNYWYSSNVPLCHDCVIFNNKGNGGSNNMQTNDLKGIDYAKPYYDQTWKSSM